MKRLTMIALALGSFSTLVACTSELQPDPGAETAPPTGSTSGDQETTYDHDNSGLTPWELIDRLQKEGPPSYTSRTHSCPKIRVRTLGSVLTSVGVDVGNQAGLSAGDLYRSGNNALGAPNFANRIRENIGITTSGASREFDIFAAAADEVITNVPNLERCKINGVSASVFDGTNACRADGITCIIGVPATPAHLEFCNLTVQNASDIATGKRLAVAAMLAAAHTCE
ncbi:MAG: hypothetical protein H0T79_10825 [Deltaproteobacteria bacterium]|nr:hypothetical protein [Deltaproteobacteria bacterium]